MGRLYYMNGQFEIFIIVNLSAFSLAFFIILTGLSLDSRPLNRPMLRTIIGFAVVVVGNLFIFEPSGSPPKLASPIFAVSISTVITLILLLVFYKIHYNSPQQKALRRQQEARRLIPIAKTNMLKLRDLIADEFGQYNKVLYYSKFESIPGLTGEFINDGGDIEHDPVLALNDLTGLFRSKGNSISRQAKLFYAMVRSFNIDDNWRNPYYDPEVVYNPENGSCNDLLIAISRSPTEIIEKYKQFEDHCHDTYRYGVSQNWDGDPPRLKHHLLSIDYISNNDEYLYESYCPFEERYINLIKEPHGGFPDALRIPALRILLLNKYIDHPEIIRKLSINYHRILLSDYDNIRVLKDELKKLGHKLPQFKERTTRLEIEESSVKLLTTYNPALPDTIIHHDWLPGVVKPQANKLFSEHLTKQGALIAELSATIAKAEAAWDGFKMPFTKGF